MFSQRLISVANGSCAHSRRSRRRTCTPSRETRCPCLSKSPEYLHGADELFAVRGLEFWLPTYSLNGARHTPVVFIRSCLDEFDGSSWSSENSPRQRLFVGGVAQFERVELLPRSTQTALTTTHLSPGRKARLRGSRRSLSDLNDSSASLRGGTDKARRQLGKRQPQVRCACCWRSVVAAAHLSSLARSDASRRNTV